MLSISPWLVEQFRRTLLSEGFRNAGIFQIWKRGQVFGYAKRIGYDLEWHVRAFVDGRGLESEVELPRRTIHHLLHQPTLNDGLLANLLSKHKMPFT